MNNINLMDEKELVDREAAYNLGFLPKQGMPTDRDTQVARLQDYMVSDRDADAAERVRQYYGEALPIKNISQDAMEYFVGAAFARQHGISGSPDAYWLGQKLDMPDVESREDLYGLMGRDLIERTRKGWEEQQKLVQERQTAMTGLLKDMVTASDSEGRAALQERFSEAYDRGVFSEADWTSVQNAREAFETLQKDIAKDFETAGANALTKSFEGEFIFDKLYNDPMAQALFLTALQERVQDLKTDVQERAVYEKAAKVFSAAGKELAARVAGGHFKEYVTDEQVDEFNAKLPQYKAWQQILQMAPGADYGVEALTGAEAMKMQSFEHSARQSGQLNEDGTLRKMTQAEWKRTGELNAFRGELYKAIGGAYDVDGVVAGLAKMMPDSLVYLVPGGMLAGFASERTRELALSLADGEDYVSAEVKATVNAAIQSTVEKMAFGGVGVTKWAPGMDWLMSRKVVGRALGRIYGTTMGRMGMGLVAGTAEETFAEPLASLLLRGAYNAVALEEFRLDDPLSEYQAEMEEMLKPEQLLVTALYGLLLGGVNVTGHRRAAADYREVYKELVKAGADEGRAAQIARNDELAGSFMASKRLFEETLKEKPASVLGYLAETFPQLQGMATMEGFFGKKDLPRLIPAENGQVKVQTRDADGNVQELVMGKESAQLLVQAKLEELTAKELAQFADAALANAMVGAMSKKSDKWDIEVVSETMDHEYFERLANAAGVRTHGKAWKERMLVARHDYEEAHGKVTDEEWEKIQQRLVSRVNRTGVRGKDGRLRTLFRVARGGFGAMEVLEDITEDNLVRDMEANGRTLDYYIENLRELEAALGKQGAFLRKLKDSDTEGDRRMAVVEAMGKLVQSKVLADTAKNSNMFSAALNAFLEMIRSWVLQAKAMMKLGAAVNKVLTDAEAAKTLDKEFVADVERLAQQDIEFLRELQLEEGLKAMQRVLQARQAAKADKRVKSRRKRSATPVLDEAEAEHGEEVREAARKKAEVQAKVNADVAAADAALEGDFSASVGNEDYLSDKDGNPIAIQTIVQRVRGLNNARLAEAKQDERYSAVIGQIEAALAGDIQGAISYRNLNQEEIELLSPTLGVDLSGYEWRFIGTELRKALNLRAQNKFSYKLEENDIKLLPVWIDEIASAPDLGKTASIQKRDNTDSFEVTLEDPMSGIRLQFQISKKTAKLASFDKPSQKRKPSINLRSCRAFITKSAGLAPARSLESAPSYEDNVTENEGEVKLNLLKQEFTSRNTSINSTKVPAVFKAVEKHGDGWKAGSVNIDIGGGKFDTLTQALADKGVKSYIYEPYGRTANENAYVLAQLQSKVLQGDTATCSNVLNVIKESAIRANVVHQVAKAIKPDGVAYFTIYEGKGNGIGAVSNDDCWQNNRKTATYVDEVRQHFGDVQLKGKLIVAREPLHRDVPAQWLLEKNGEVMSFSMTDAQERGLFEDGVLEASNAVVTEPSFSIEALHATPHKFRKFDTSKMGTGEGAQAFGWGLYFSGDKGSNREYYRYFAEEDYQMRLFRGDNELGEKELQKLVREVFMRHGGQELVDEMEEAIVYSVLREGAQKQLDDYEAFLKDGGEDISGLSGALQELAGMEIERKSVNLPAFNYRVELNADDSNLLLWDEKVPAELHDAVRELKSGQPARGLVMQMPEASKECWEGYRIYSELTSVLGTPKAASEWLAERGYKGIKYLDGMSRRAGEGTYNYVIFSGDDVKITGVNETGDYNAPWEDYEDTDASFNVVGESAANWDEIKERAFVGRDDGKLRVELDASQAKLKKVKRHAMDDSVVDELRKRLEWFTSHVKAAGRWDEMCRAWQQGEYAYTVRELAFLSDTLGGMGIELPSFARMKSTGVFELVTNPSEEAERQFLKKKKVKGVLGYNRLGEVLDFPELYRSYPQLAYVPVWWMDEKFKYRGMFSLKKHLPPTILVKSKRSAGGILSTLLHEAQHWIQMTENFVWGALPKGDGEYKYAAGEIEARNVQQRRWMNADERAELPFNETLQYPGEARVVTFEEARASMSVTDPAVEEYRENTIEFNVVSAMDEDARAWQRDKMAEAGLTEDEIEDYFALLDGMVSEVLDVSKDWPEFKVWQEMAVQRWVKGGVVTPTVSAFKKNGDYPVNIDLGTICVKREMMTLLTDKLVSEGYADRLGVSQIEQLKDLMKEAGIATACDICFVEARRIRALIQAQQLSFFWNAVRAAAGIEGHEPIGKHGELTTEQVAKLEKMANKETRDAALLELVDDMHRRKEKFDKGLSPKTMSIIATCFLQDASLAGEAVLGDFMSVGRVDFMLRGYPHTQVRQLLASAFGPSTAKPVEGFNVYDALSWRQDFNDNALEEKREQLYKIGGGRVQSFTDFNPVLFMDYYQMVFDFAWRGLPLQAYTKVESFVELFGQTGIKINMSLVPAVEDGVPDEYAGMKKGADGSWEFAWHKDSFPIDLAYKYRKDAKMHQNVGTIAVGISREHVRALLRDERIDYVIPYHRSGMPVATQIKTGLNKATDFTDVQNTRKPGVKAYKDKWKFNEALRELGDPKAAAQAYLDYCDKNGLIPKFDEFRNEENYYKLLVDFRVYDRDGAYAPQGPVTTQMPDGWGKVLEKALGSRAKTVERMDALLENEAFMERARGIMKQTPLEGEVRELMVKRLTSALKTKDVGEPVVCMRAADFDKKVYEVCRQTLQQEDAAKMSEVLRLQNGIIYGFTQGGVLYLKENTFNANTPAHEFTHVWAKVAQMANPKLWAKGVELLKKTVHWGDVMTDPLYFNIHGNEDAVASEVLARMAGNMSERMVRELTDPAKKQLTEKGLVAKIAEWVKSIWKSVRSLFDKVDGKRLTLDEFAKMPLCDLWVPTRNRKFNAYVKKHLSKSVDEQRAEIQALAEDFSASMVNLDEEVVAAEVVAAGQGFKANLAYSESIMKEMRGAMQRLRKLGGKTRTDREDAVAAMGTMVQMVKAAVAHLPQGYRFSVHPYLNRIEALAELAASGDIDLTSDIASKDILQLENAEGVDLKKSYDEMVKEYGNVKLAAALERIMHRVSEQLRKHAKDRAVEKITELVERLAPKKDPKNGKLKGGKMSADAYRDLATVAEAMGMDEGQLEAKLASLREEMAKPDISEEMREALEDELVLYDQFGNLAGMTAEDAVAAYEALRVRVYYHRFEWEDRQARVRGARREVVRNVVDGVGSVSENEYNAKKRRVKASKRLKNLGDILSGMPAVLHGMSGYLPLREMADELAVRTNNAGELIKAWEAERWLALEALSKETMGKSWRECMAFMHKVNPSGVSFDRPKFRTVNVKTDELRELLAMTKAERKAEMKRRRDAGGLEAERALSERDVQELQKKLEAMEEEGRVLSRVEARYMADVQHEENLQLSRGEALYAILMFEQPTYTERLIMQGYTFEVIEGLREYVGDGMLQFGYGLRELFAQQGDRIAAVYEAAFGVPFPREENYFAARWMVNGMKENPAEQLLAGMAGTAGAGNGWMKQRVNHNLELDMTKDALQVFLQATSLTDTWMATQDIVADFKAWTRDADFERAMTVTLGKESYDNLKDWIRILEMGGVQDCLNMGTSQDVINGLYGSGAVAILGLRIQTLLKQTPSVFNGLLGAHDISAAEWFATLARLKHGDAPMTYKRMLESQLMKSRQQGKAGAMAGQAQRSGDSESSVTEELLLASMLPMEWVDARSTALGLVPVWNVYYQRAVDQGSSHEEAERAAWEQTALVANLSSQPIGWLNKSKIAQHRNPIVKSLFYMLSENLAKFSLCRALWQGGHKVAAIRAWLVYGAANAAISAMLDALQGDPEEWEKGNWWEYVFSALYGPAAGIPGVGEMLEALVNSLLNATGEAADIEWMKKMKTHTSVGRALVDVSGSVRALTKIYGFLTDEEEHSLAEYTRAASTISRTVAIGSGWMGNAFGYWSTAVAVLMNPIDFGARVWRNMKHYAEE